MIIQANGHSQYQTGNLDVVSPQWRRVSDKLSGTTPGAAWSKVVNRAVLTASLTEKFQKRLILLSNFLPKSVLSRLSSICSTELGKDFTASHPRIQPIKYPAANICPGPNADSVCSV